MACFLVPASEAVVTTAAELIVKSKEKKSGAETKAVEGFKFSKKLGILNKMLWGGSALLAFEHLWHGEIKPTFPFLTAVEEGNVSEMLGEMSSVGVAMAIVVTVVWGIMMAVATRVSKENEKTENITE